MSSYKDPTAWAAIANVMREGKQKPKAEPLPTHGDAVRYIERPKGTGQRININSAELFYSRMRRAADDTKGAQSIL